MTHIARVARPTQQLDALAHLRRGLVGERDRQDLARLGLPGADQVRDPVGQDARLARAGAREDQQRAFAVRHGVALGRIEALEEGIDGERRRARRTTTVAPGGGGAPLALGPRGRGPHRRDPRGAAPTSPRARAVRIDRDALEGYVPRELPAERPARADLERRRREDVAPPSS